MKWLISILLLFPFLGLSQGLQLTVSKNPVSVGEQFRIDFVFEGSSSDFKGPNFNGLRKISGPNQSSSSSMQIINGKVTSSKTTTYSFYVSALNEGTLTIGEASVKSNGKTYRSKAAQIEVLKANPKSKTNTYSIAENVYVEAKVSRRTIFQGEQVIVSYKLYSKINLSDINLTAVPELNGFWKEEVETNSTPKLEVIDGVRHNVWEINRFILTPQKSGTLDIDPLKINVSIQIKNRQSNDPFRDPFGFFGSYQNIEEELSSKNISIKVKDLPQGAPKNFSGAVGQFKLKASVDKLSVNTNQALNYKLTLSGNGNIHLIDNIPASFPQNFEAYDPQKKDKTFTTNSGIAGKIEFEHLLIPRYKGEYVIEGTEFSYFDTKSKKYNTLKTDPIIINVLKGKDGVESYFSSDELQASKSQQLKDIKPTTTLLQKDNRQFNLSILYILIIIPIIALLVFLIVQYIDQINKSNPILNKYRKSLKTAQKRLKKAQKHLENDKKELFFEEIEKSLWSYFSNKFNVNSADLAKETINDFFSKNNISKKVSNNFTSIIEKCEFCRFAPSSLDSEDMNKVLDLATQVIVEVEQDLKK